MYLLAIFLQAALIEEQRPELKKDNLNAADSPTFESKMEEMRKYPHQDNHMD